MTEQRNFRSAYLEKVGIKGVEEKKSLEILLNEQPLDIIKLNQFCIRFPVPASHRSYLWKVLLDVLPVHQASHQYVSEQRQQQYDDLHEALEAMCKIDETSPLHEVHLKMFLVENGLLPFNQSGMMNDVRNRTFTSVTTAMSEVAEEPTDIYWLSTKFYKLQLKHTEILPEMVGRIDFYLKKEDGDGHLCEHLMKLKAYQHLHFTDWFSSCFASVLPMPSLARIWDKIIGGSYKILVFVAVAMLLTLKRPILSMKTISNVEQYLSKIPDDNGDIIVNKAVELWHKYGCLLLPVTTRGNSPVITDKVYS